MDVNLKTFFEKARKGLFAPKLEENEVNGCELIINEYLKQGGSCVHELSYILATVFHEVNGTMQPIKELGGDRYYFTKYDIRGSNIRLARMLGNIEKGDGAKYAGRGFVQITGRSNYDKLSKILGIDLIGNPDLALQPSTSAKILVHGMMNGTFTGKKLSDYFNGDNKNYLMARKIINGTDKKELVALYARKFESYLKV